jgi:hypothetical protein
VQQQAAAKSQEAAEQQEQLQQENGRLQHDWSVHIIHYRKACKSSTAL